MANKRLKRKTQQSRTKQNRNVKKQTWKKKYEPPPKQRFKKRKRTRETKTIQKIYKDEKIKSNIKLSKEFLKKF